MSLDWDGVPLRTHLLAGRGPDNPAGLEPGEAACFVLVSSDGALRIGPACKTHRRHATPAAAASEEASQPDLDENEPPEPEDFAPDGGLVGETLATDADEVHRVGLTDVLDMAGHRGERGQPPGLHGGQLGAEEPPNVLVDRIEEHLILL